MNLWSLKECKSDNDAREVGIEWAAMQSKELIKAVFREFINIRWKIG
jgi:hypothetical protein